MCGCMKKEKGSVCFYFRMFFQCYVTFGVKGYSSQKHIYRYVYSDIIGTLCLNAKVKSVVTGNF